MSTNPKFPSLPPLNFQFTIPALPAYIGVPSVPARTFQIKIDGLDAIEGTPTLADVVREHDRFIAMCRARDSIGETPLDDKMDDDVFGAAIMRYQNVLNSRSSADMGNNTDEVLLRLGKIQEQFAVIQEQMAQLQQITEAERN